MKTYKVNEIFYSVQAEGRNSGRPAIFVRFSGCNLQCPFCDTNHEPYRLMTKDEIEKEVNELDKDSDSKAMIVMTGGEPTVQVDDEEFLFEGRYIAMETNGILPPPYWVDWVTVSPKTKINYNWSNIDELKFLYGWFDDDYLVEVGKQAEKKMVKCYIQPTADHDNNFDALPSIEFAKKHPQWTLSLQFHKLLNIR